MGCTHQGQSLLSMIALLLLLPHVPCPLRPLSQNPGTAHVTNNYNRKIIRNDHLATNNNDLEDYFSNTFNIRTCMQTVTGSQLPRDCNTHTHTRFWALCILSRTTWVSQCQKKHSPTHTYPDHPLCASSTYCNPWHPTCSIYMPDSCTKPVQVLFGLPHHLAPSTSYSTHFFTQSLFSFFSFSNTINTTTTCFAVVSRLYHLILVTPLTLYLVHTDGDLYLKTVTVTISCSYNCFCTCVHRHDCQY